MLSQSTEKSCIRSSLGVILDGIEAKLAGWSRGGVVFVEFMPEKTYSYVSNFWNDAEASGLDPVGRLIYRSNKLGSDQRITNTGGGNTSAKIVEKDPLTGKPVEVLWVKGSG